MKISYFKFVLSIIFFSVTFTNGYTRHRKFNDDEHVYLIKFLHPYTNYPVKLVDHTAPVLGTSVRWFKYGSNYFIDELDQHFKYFSNETEFLDNDLGKYSFLYLRALIFNSILSQQLLKLVNV
jgi:hypothetical protein